MRLRPHLFDMHRGQRLSVLGLAAVLVAAFAATGESQAQTPGAGPSAEQVDTNEPRVQRIVIEDDGARIEELRVRGQTQRITVQPRGNMRRYEILTNDNARSVSDGVDSQRGSAGRRVWNVLNF